MTRESIPKTIIEFVDTAPSSLAHKTHEIRINGQKVLAEMDSTDFIFEEGCLTSVRMTLLPHEIHFNHEADK